MTLTPAAFAFLRELEVNNEKAWFEAHRADYERDVKKPMAALVLDVTTALAARQLPLEGDAKRSTFRIHRDVRFSKNKSPYKTALGSVWYRQGSGKDGAGVLYFHLGARGCFVGVAFYQPEAEALDAIRERIRVHPGRWMATIDALASAGVGVELGDSLTRMPKGYEDMKESPLASSLRLRSYVVRRILSDALVTGPGLVPAIVDLAEAALPLLRFGWAAIDEAATA